MFSEGSSVSHMCKKAIFCCFQKKTIHVLDAEQKVYSTAKSFIKKYWKNKKLFKIEILKKLSFFPYNSKTKPKQKSVWGKLSHISRELSHPEVLPLKIGTPCIYRY